MLAENTPILAGAIPSFELFMASWKAMLRDPDLQHKDIGKFINPGLAIANKYYDKMGETDAYIIAMFSGAFFPKARNFVLSGGTFTSITNNYVNAAIPTDFRTIPLGDIDLQREIRVDYESGVLDFNTHTRRVVRRLYSAKVDRRKPDMTVALYQGDDAEKDWRQDVSTYSRLRHPNFLQLYGITSASGIHAAIFHDGQHFFKGKFDADVLVYIYGYWSWDFHEARHCFQDMFKKDLLPHPSQLWIRSSTGRLCADPIRYENTSGDSGDAVLPPPHLLATSQPHPFAVLHDAEPNVTPVLSSMAWDLYHFICWWHFSEARLIPLPPSETLVFNPINQSIPAGYLFVCPPEDFRVGPASFRWPEHTAYWSRDPEGVDCIPMDRAPELGFPAVQWQIKIQASWWDDSFYAGMRQFHEERGFRPESQDLARHLGSPLFEVYNAPVPFAFIEAEESEAENLMTDTDDEYIQFTQDSDSQKDTRDDPEKILTSDFVSEFDQETQHTKDLSSGYDLCDKSIAFDDTETLSHLDISVITTNFVPGMQLKKEIIITPSRMLSFLLGTNLFFMVCAVLGEVFERIR
ncbi:hypothetical protein K438DRAFT_1969136 [Mycena galopus ATCC 62051]|nr:hypothetical protein K438DRAFT_1969136 [Mycena galopus ATCC 62051]